MFRKEYYIQILQYLLFRTSDVIAAPKLCVIVESKSAGVRVCDSCGCGDRKQTRVSGYPVESTRN